MKTGRAAALQTPNTRPSTTKHCGLLLTTQMVLHYSIGPEHEFKDRYRHRLFVIPRLHVLALYEGDEEERLRNPALQLAL